MFFASVSTDMSSSLNDVSQSSMAQDGMEFVEQEMTHMEGNSVGMMMAVAGGMAIRKGLTSLTRTLSGKSLTGNDDHRGSRRRSGGKSRHALSSVMELKPQLSTRSTRRSQGERLGVAAPSSSTFSFLGPGDPLITTPWY